MEQENIIEAADVIDTKLDEDLLIPVDNNSSISNSSSADEDESDNALEQRLVRQVTEMFSRSMFMYSNMCGKKENKKMGSSAMIFMFSSRYHQQLPKILRKE